jgi:hypothetical protein
MRFAALVLVACSSSSPPPKPPAAPPPKCAAVADHMLELMSPDAKGAPTEQLDSMRRLFNDHCRDDHWSVEAQDCFLSATSRTEIAERCASMLTGEQGMAFGTAIEEQRPSSPTSDAGVVDGP